MSVDSNNILYMTGGGGLSQNSINISTLSAIIANSLGLRVIKHVSYESPKKCPSAVFLENLKIKVCKNIHDIETSFDKHEIAFVEALPDHVLDNLCPLIAPVNMTRRFIGINNVNLAMQYLFELKNKNYKRAIIVCPADAAFDEIVTCGCTQIFELNDGQITNYVINPLDFGILETESIALTGATPLYNCNLSKDILSKKIRGSKLDVLAMNTGAILYVAGCTNTIKEGIVSAYKAVSTGLALGKLESLKG